MRSKDSSLRKHMTCTAFKSTKVTSLKCISSAGGNLRTQRIRWEYTAAWSWILICFKFWTTWMISGTQKMAKNEHRFCKRHLCKRLRWLSTWKTRGTTKNKTKRFKRKQNLILTNIWHRGQNKKTMSLHSLQVLGQGTMIHLKIIWYLVLSRKGIWTLWVKAWNASNHSKKTSRAG